MNSRLALIAVIFANFFLAGLARAEGPVMIVDDPAVLAALDARGFDFAGIFDVDGKGDLKTLYDKAPPYHQIVETIAGDVAALRAEMKAGGRSLYEVTDGNVGRIIDMRWLKTDAARFRLVGVVNRLDRRDFAEIRGDGGCGEVRFIYRLAYSFKKNGKVLASRLPFNFNAIYSVAPDADGGCVGVAGRWTPQLDETVDIGWLIGEPLERAGLSFKQLELNAQMVRFPSGQETEFGGQAAYLMRIFGVDGETVSEKPLENTPDLARLADDAALKAKLAVYISANLAAVDLGVYKIPNEFLVKKVVSWSTFGSARQANHPFTPLFQPADFSGLDYSALKLLRIGRAARQWRLPGLSSGWFDRRFPFHRPRRQDDIAAEPHRGRHLAASSCRDAAARSLAACDRRRQGAEPPPPAVLRAAGRVERRRRGRLRTGRDSDAVFDAGGCGPLRRDLAMRRRHRLHGAGDGIGGADETGAMPAAQGQRKDVLRPSMPDRLDRQQRHAAFQ
ncbi:hypothetical protein ACN2CC_17385 [Mesorhizobium muleiense]|uniref:hypothetical protein n=1 Tax=Mesorhizobium muleiense TaxID=1004279 RepID=UPI003AFB2744